MVDPICPSHPAVIPEKRVFCESKMLALFPESSFLREDSDAQSWIPCRGQTFREEPRKAGPLHGMTGGRATLIDIKFAAQLRPALLRVGQLTNNINTLPGFEHYEL